MEFSTWLLFLLTEAVLCFSPGPAVIYVMSQGLSHGFRASLAANLGVVTGNSIYFLASALGLGAMILTSQQLFLLIKWIGVAYLVWLGLQMIFTSGNIPDPVGVRRRPDNKAFKGGTVVQLANPKNLVFFVAILPPFIDPNGNVALQVLILGLTSQLLEVIALLFYGSIAANAGGWLQRSRLSVWVERIAGTFLIGIAASLAFVRRAEP
ncbi:MAG: LysE family translocator [Hyphomicrobiaceae bacterium]|nr:LysE family translocator [Hyphomicrobiaceae bacterium]